MELKGERIILREYRKEDVGRIVEIANNKKIAKNLAGIFPYPYTLDEAKKWIEIATSPEKINTHFVIEFEREMIGTISFSVKEAERKGTAVCGYWIGEDCWGKGFATEALKLMLDYAFKNYDIRRMEAGVYSWNPPSANVLEKCGFKKEGELRKNICHFDEICNELRYGILKEEWEKKR
ncbi:MAG: GNAT family protein [Nanoarchaeota archaeon]|nr:GNAT family protein [Nanoarchaeota archaeon]